MSVIAWCQNGGRYARLFYRRAFDHCHLAGSLHFPVPLMRDYVIAAVLGALLAVIIIAAFYVVLSM